MAILLIEPLQGRRDDIQTQLSQAGLVCSAFPTRDEALRMLEKYAEHYPVVMNGPDFAFDDHVRFSEQLERRVHRNIVMIYNYAYWERPERIAEFVKRSLS